MKPIETLRHGQRTWTLLAGESELKRWVVQESPARGSFASQETRGRGQIHLIPLQENRQGVLRHLRHGGLSRFLGDIFVGSSRVMKEFFLLLRAREMGAPVPLALAAGTERFWGIFYRGDLVTEQVPSQTLRELLQETPPQDLKPLLKMLLALHRRGLEHIDLNLDNVLIPHDGSDWLAVDFDQGCLHEVLSLEKRVNSLLRLDRSYQKHFGPQGPVGAIRRYRFWHHYFKNIGIPPHSMLFFLRREKIKRQWHRWGWQLKKNL